jgi:hypothetical protein
VPPSDAAARGALLVEVVGKVAAVDRAGHRISVDTPRGRVDLSLDRNTLVYLPTGVGTVLDVLPGAAVRAGRDGDFVAYWIQVLSASP